MAALSGAKIGAIGLYMGRNCSAFFCRTRQFAKVGIVGTNHVAHLTATHGEPYPRAKPWPYKTRGYNIFYELFDKTTKRLNDNSKVIVVEGNMALNKHKLAEDLAREFDLLYVPAPKFDDIFILPWSGFDIRELDEQLPKAAQAWDLKRFYTDPNAKRSRVGLSQVFFYADKVFTYAKAVHHMLSTGQGVVLVRSPHSDIVFANTMRKFDYYTSAGLKYYNMIRDNSVCDILPPHLTIYLDAPVSKVREGIQRRNIPHEVNSRVLTDEYIQSIDNEYKTKVLPDMRRRGAVLQYDLREDLDLEIVVEDMERLDLDTPPEDYPERFSEWNTLKEDEWAYYRKFYGSDIALGGLFARPMPINVPELMLDTETATAWRSVVENHPGFKYEKNFDPEHNHILFRM